MNCNNPNIKQGIITLFCFFFLHSNFAQNKDVEAKFSLLIDNLVANQSKSEDLNINSYFEGKEMVSLVNDSLAIKFYGHYHWYFFHRKRNKECKETGKKLLQLSKKYNDYYQITSITGHMVSIYASEQKKDSAIAMNRNMLKYYENRYVKNYSNNSKIDYSFEENTLSCYNNIGFFFSEGLKQRDSALYYFNKAVELPQVNTRNFRFLLHSINDNIALIYMKEGNFEKARQLFLKNEIFYGRDKIDTERWMRASLQWAQSEINLEQFTNAEKRLFIAKKRLDSLGSYLNKVRNEILYNKTMESLFLNKENYKSAKAYSNKADELIYNESLKEKEKSEKQLSLFNDIDIQRTRKLYYNEKLLHKKEKNVRQLFSWLLVSVIITSIVVLYLLRLRNRLRIQKANTEKLVEKERAKTVLIENELLQKEIDYKKKDLALFANVISENQKWGNYLLSQIKSLKKIDVGSQKELISNLEDEINHKITLEQDNSFFQKRIEILNSKFFENLLKSYPNLTKIELKLCSLIRLDIENKDIARIQNISPDSIYRSRTRLRKKLNLSSTVNLNIFLKKF